MVAQATDDAALISRTRAAFENRDLDPKIRAETVAEILLEFEKRTKGPVAGREDRIAVAADALVVPLLPALVQAADDDNAGVRSITALLLGFAPPGDDVIRAVLRLARDPVADVNGPALGALGRLGRDVPEARSLVVEFLDPSDPQRFGPATHVAAMWQMPEAVRPLMAALASPKLGIQEAAARALGRIGSAASSALPALESQAYQLRFAANQMDAAAAQIRDALSRTPVASESPVARQ